MEDHAAFAVAAWMAQNATGRSFVAASAEPVTGEELAVFIKQKVGRQVRYEPYTPHEFGAMLGNFIGADAGREIAADYEGLDSLPPGAAVVDMAKTFKVLNVQPTTISDWVKKQNWKLG